ncbi:DUF2182 domain-containing protein [Rhodoplanes sp. TEM]|uniref:DUF2182 domain-containing protein n=1 Tax=Rhodoplanes tepidamans TaxID=200616 RepID=A0ABT5J9V3_RHOTP|nr:MULTISPECIES: DUF2182 domain-containing protein [Rhodoplanes]MDC7786445.1 DUF2182 domain-containing protein [Rhodoplanes tepidamans]MDC7985087.1 DUF2182 domain-containing protein [Rhodoplanes sp. TEM]MDQ0357330.1 putative metal-binding membrane protein [Rhodoplanes tepidamans]
MTDTPHRSDLVDPPSGPPEVPLLARPVVVALACLVVLAGLGWLYLGLMVAGMAGAGSVAAMGPGMGLFDLLGGGVPLDGFAKALAEAICSPSFGQQAGVGLAELATLAGMWAAMALAMMLPTAGPMILSYAEIAATAARRGEPTVSPVALIVGYAGVWLAFALVAAALQAGLARLALLDPAMASASPLFSGAVFVGAGVYQFSPLKYACVTRCQRPFPFFLLHWTSRAGGVVRLGMRQGLLCLGCCWAMMLVMFAVGVMNVVWMALLGIVMGAEKIAVTTRFSKAIGVVFLAIGAWMIGDAVMAHWPAARAG